MSRKLVRGVALVLVATLALTLVASGIFSMLSTPAAAASSSEIKQQLADLDEEKERLQQEIDSLSDDIADATAKKENLEQQINVTVSEITATNQLIEELEMQIAQKTEELAEAEQALEEKEDLFKTRIRVMCENGDTSYLDLLLTSGNFSELLTRIEMVNRIMEYDKEVVTDYTEAKQAVEDAKTTLENNRAEQVSLKDQLEEQHSSLQTQQAEVDALTQRLSTELTQTKEEAAALEAERDALSAELQQISAQSGSNNSGGGNATPTGSLTWPCPAYRIISSPFGYRIHPILGYNKLHTGVDLAASTGVDVLAADGGTVIKSRYNSSYGNYIAIDHGNGMVTLYAHMSQRLVSVGQTVSAGQVIGKVGSTGDSTGPHLHFEVIVNGSYQNPMSYFN